MRGLGLWTAAPLEIGIFNALEVRKNRYLLGSMVPLQFAVGTLAITEAIIKHFYDFWKLYNNAIAIKSLMLKDSIQK